MSEQLRRAMAQVGPDAVQRTRLLLIAAGESALADSSMKCLLYAGLATATADRRGLPGEDEDFPDPLLLAAVMSANQRAPGTVTRVGDELDEVWVANDDPLVYALAKELIMASCQALLVCDRAAAEMEDFETLGDWPA